MIHALVALLVFCLVPCVTAAELVTLDAASRARAGIVLRPVLERSFGARFSVVGEVVRSPGGLAVKPSSVMAKSKKTANRIIARPPSTMGS